MRDFRVTVTVRNNLLLSAIEDAGYESVAAFTRDFAVSYKETNAFLGLKRSPIRRDGSIDPHAELICAALGKNLHELFPERFMERCLERNSITTQASEADMTRLLTGADEAAKLVIESDARKAINDALAGLSDRQRTAITRYYGLDGEPRMTLAEIGKSFGVTQERIRSIILAGEAKMRHPSRAKPLRAALNGLTA